MSFLITQSKSLNSDEIYKILYKDEFAKKDKLYLSTAYLIIQIIRVHLWLTQILGVKRGSIG